MRDWGYGNEVNLATAAMYYLGKPINPIIIGYYGWDNGYD